LLAIKSYIKPQLNEFFNQNWNMTFKISNQFQSNSKNFINFEFKKYIVSLIDLKMSWQKYDEFLPLHKTNLQTPEFRSQRTWMLVSTIAFFTYVIMIHNSIKFGVTDNFPDTERSLCRVEVRRTQDTRRRCFLFLFAWKFLSLLRSLRRWLS